MSRKLKCLLSLTQRAWAGELTVES